MFYYLVSGHFFWNILYASMNLKYVLMLHALTCGASCPKEVLAEEASNRQNSEKEEVVEVERTRERTEARET